jgi:uncharacterized protein YdaU (DUF1376 family)
VITRSEQEQKAAGASVQAFFHLTDEAQAARKRAEAERKAEREKAAYAAAIGLSLIALFSLVLVLLAIERNTRPGLREA